MEGIWIFLGMTVVAISAFFIAKYVVDAKSRVALLRESKSKSSVVLPLRLQAYERMALFLERIDPNQLVMRIHAAGLIVSQEQNLLLTAIRSEFEHNLSQQIYISDSVWQNICDAKADIESIINTVAADMDKNAESREFAELILEVAAKKPVVEIAIRMLKADMAKWAY